MSTKEEMSKDKRLSNGRDIMDGIKDGELSIKINLQRLEERDTAMNSDSTS
jgi:hypothetical protein